MLAIGCMTMRPHNNSQSEFYLAVLCGVYHDLVGAIIPQSEIRRDLVEIQNRVSSEGLGFLTKTLPALGKAVDRSLGQSSILQFRGFKKAKGTQLPAFAGTLFKILFTNEGAPRQAKPGVNPSRETMEHLNPGAGSGNASGPCRETQVMALKALRQVFYLCYKIEIPYHEDQVQRVIESFKTTEQDLRKFKPEKAKGPEAAILRKARHLVCRVLANSDPYTGIPKHGPGSVSTGETSPEKHNFSRLYSWLDRRFNFTEWFELNLNHTCESYSSGHLSRLRVAKHGEAKVVLVPKDSRGPRLISAEPLEYQWVQQALLSVLVPTLESHPMTKGHVNFSKQEVNRDLALEGSRTARWATLDMKDASDRVSLRLVKALFPTRWFEALFAARTPRTRLPDGTKVTMRKFAPMGSAVCFPVEALVFWSLSVAALLVHKDITLRKALSSIFVYGDDIVCDADDHGVIIQCLERFALKVNQDKCCTTGNFKESCGMDAFHGSSVTPLKLRKVWSSALKPSALASYIEFSNSMYQAGCFLTAEIVERFLQVQTGNSIPIVSDRGPAIHCFVRTHQLARQQPSGVKTRYNTRLQRLEARGMALRSTSFMTKTFGYPLLLRLLAEKEREAIVEGVVPLRPKPGSDVTGSFAIAHREKPTRAWTPLSV